MKSKLSSLCSYRKGKIAVSELDSTNYISTENMLADKGGITKSSGLPASDFTQAYYKNDVLVSNIRPYFKKIWFANMNGGCSNDVLVFTANNECEPSFLYYVLSNDDFFNYATVTAKGTKMPRGDKKAIMEYEVPIYDIDTQKKIASILSALDDKIEVNQKINENLEQQAQAIFKSWFVDFEPFGGVMPRNWKIGVISDLAKDIICGKTPSTKKSEFYGTEIPFITIPDMHNNIYITQTERYLSKLGAESQKGKMLPKNSICVSCIGTAGLVSLVCSQSQTNQQINSIIPKEEISPYYIFLLMKTLSKTIQNLGSGGSTICNLNKNQFSNIEIMLPTNEVNKKFDEKVLCMFEKIKQNQIENNVLAKLRDTLLPKLMNGEIDVGGVEL